MKLTVELKSKIDNYFENLDPEILIERLEQLGISFEKIDDFDVDKVNIDTSGVFIPRRLEGRKNQLVKERLRELNITKIYPDGSVDVDGDVDLGDLGLIKIPIKFNKVSGSFCCNDNQLTNLENCPKEVGKNFSCRNNELTSLEGYLIEVNGNFYCGKNRKQFTEEQVREVCNVKGNIFCYSYIEN